MKLCVSQLFSSVYVIVTKIVGDHEIDWDYVEFDVLGLELIG